VQKISIKWLHSSKSYCGLFCLLVLTACGHTPVSLTLSEVVRVGKSIDSIVLNPNLSYLRVTVGSDRPVLMVLGYLEPSTHGPVETWYSNEGEVLNLHNGRIVATKGLAVDWVNTRYYSLHAWSDMVRRMSAEFGRQTDQMPGYRFDINENISIASVRAPNNSNLVGVSADNLSWYEETVRGTSHGLPSARYGLRLTSNGPVVVYGEQCLSKDFCISWQSWPVKP
jgi:hypothetical protein